MICIPSGRGWRATPVLKSLFLAMCINLNLSKFWDSQGLYEVIISIIIHILFYIKSQLSLFIFLHPKCLFRAFLWRCFLPIIFCLCFDYFTSFQCWWSKKKITNVDKPPCLQRNTPSSLNASSSYQRPWDFNAQPVHGTSFTDKPLTFKKYFF